MVLKNPLLMPVCYFFLRASHLQFSDSGKFWNHFTKSDIAIEYYNFFKKRIKNALTLAKITSSFIQLIFIIEYYEKGIEIIEVISNTIHLEEALMQYSLQ